MKYCFVYGAGGHAKVVIDVIRYTCNIRAIYDDNPKEDFFCYYPVLKTSENFKDIQPSFGIVAIGVNYIRMKISDKLVGAGKKLISAIHPSAVVNCDIGDGTVVMPGAVVNVDAEIKRAVIINTNATVEHDCTISDGVHIGPGATLCGNVFVGDRTLIGANATIIPGITIGNDSIVGAGAVVIRDIPDNMVACGNPAVTMAYHSPRVSS